MKKTVCGMIFGILLLTSPNWAQNNAPYDVQTAQQRVWDIQLQLNNARYRLAIMKLDLQKDRLSENLLKAQQKGNQAQIAQIQQQLQNIDRLKALEQQRLDLDGQILIAQQQNNSAQVQSLQFQLRSLR